jgi:hypothetical protein
MNCQEFWNTMPELDVAAAHPHLDACPACRTRLQRSRELAAGLRAVAAEFHKVEAPSRVEARLLSAFRVQSGIEPVRARRPWIAALTWTAAVAAMLALGIFLVRERQPEAVAPPVSHAVERAAVETPSALEGFIALPNSGALPAADEAEDMDVVHVEVPRSAMLAVGLDVSPDQTEEMVEADIMLGTDGVARAVRFLD